MKVLSDYILCAFLASLAAGVVERLSSSSGSLKKYVRFIASLILLFLLARPLISLVGLLSDFSEKDLPIEQPADPDPSYEVLLRTTEKKVAEAIEKDLSSSLGTDETVTVKPELVMEEDGNLLLIKIHLFLPKAYSGRAENIKEYLETKYRAAVTVEITGG